MAAFSHNGEPGSALDAELKGHDTRHREGYAAGFKAGYESGLRRAAEIADKTEAVFIKESAEPDLTGGYAKHYAACASGAGAVEVAILAEAEK